jgi:hypothetical protein
VKIKRRTKMGIRKISLITSDFPVVDSNFNFIVINASRTEELEKLVVLKKDTCFHRKMDIPSDYIIIVDRYKKFLTSKLELLEVTEDIIEEEYLSYLRKN